MASSNRHWPSMFKSKPCNPQSQWQHDYNPSLLSSYNYINPYTSGVQERSPEPKPRWNPKPEQIRILEGIFNSGMVNPPRDEIRKIRAQLQEYGQVGDANVFYWFQNRKSRTKHKNRQLSKQQLNKSSRSATSTTNTNIVTPSMITNPSSSSSSSDKSSSNLNKRKTSPNDLILGSNFLNQLACSSTASTNQTTYGHVVQHEPFMFPLEQLSNSTQGFTGFHDQPSHSQPLHMMTPNMNNSAIIPHSVGPCGELLFSELMSNEHGESYHKKDVGDEETLMMMKLGYPNSTSASSLAPNSVPIPTSTSTLAPFQDDSCASAIVGAVKSTVFFNDVAFEVDSGPFNVRNAFGNDAVLLHFTGQPVLTNELGVTIQPLEHGAFYYVI